MTDQEQEWLHQIQCGDFSAFRKIMEQYQEKLYFLALDLVGNPQDAQDMLQESFVKIFSGLQSFRGEAALGSWFYRITVNTCLDYLRKMKRESHFWDLEQNRDRVLHLMDHEVQHNPEKNLDRQTVQRLVRKAIDHLSPRERTVFILRHYHDLTLREIAETLRLAQGTVKSLHFRGIRKLQKELKTVESELE